MTKELEKRLQEKLDEDYYPEERGRICFEDGFRFRDKIESEQVQGLVEALSRILNPARQALKKFRGGE